MRNRAFASLIILIGNALTQLGMAVEEEASAAKTIERIQVTGTRLKKIDAEGSTPITIMDREEIEQSGAVTIRDFMQNFSGTTTAFADSILSFELGVGSAGLKGFGPARTLILVDGVRLPKHPSLAAVDLNTIPLAAVEKIEVLRQSASAVYGADAVGGVINIITRKNYRGTQAQVLSKHPIHPGGASKSLGVSTGFGADRSSSVLVASYERQGTLEGQHRDFSKRRFTSTGYPGSYAAALPSVDAQGQSTTLTKSFPVKGCPNYQEVSGQVLPASGCTFDYSQGNGIFPAVERLSGLYNFSYELPNGLQFTGKLLASRQNLELQTRPEGTIGRDVLPVVAQDVIDAMPQERYDQLFPAFNGQKPTAGGVRLNLRFSDFGFIQSKKDTTLLGAIAGLEGDFAPAWKWKLLVHNSLNRSGFRSAPRMLLGPTNEAFAAGELIPWDPEFDGAGMRQRLLAKSSHKEKSYIYGGEVLITGEAGSLPGGSVALAFGASSQMEGYAVNWDNVTAQNLFLNVSGVGGNGEREVLSAFAEASLPISSSFEASLATRIDHYSDFGSTFNPQLNFAFAPFADLKLRGAVGTAFKAPSLHELHGATGISYKPLVDYTYCNSKGISVADCPRDPVASFFVKNVLRSNPDLDPEKSEIYAFGLVLQPLSLTLDYWKVKSRDLIDYRDQQDLVNENSPAVVRSPDDGVIDFIDLPIQNLAKSTRAGVDLAFDFRQNFAKLFLSYRSMGTWYVEDKLTPGGKAEQNRLGKNGSFKWKLSQNLSLLVDKLYGFGLASSTLGTHAKYGSDTQRLPQYTRYDAFALYRGPWDGEVTLGVNNILDTQGGIDDSNLGNVRTDIYSITGREYYLRLTQNF